MTFTMTGSTDMGLKSDGWTAAVLLGTGVTKRSKWDETPPLQLICAHSVPSKASRLHPLQKFGNGSPTCSNAVHVVHYNAEIAWLSQQSRSYVSWLATSEGGGNPVLFKMCLPVSSMIVFPRPHQHPDERPMSDYVV